MEADRRRLGLLQRAIDGGGDTELMAADVTDTDVTLTSADVAGSGADVAGSGTTDGHRGRSGAAPLLVSWQSVAVYYCRVTVRTRCIWADRYLTVLHGARLAQ